MTSLWEYRNTDGEVVFVVTPDVLMIDPARPTAPGTSKRTSEPDGFDLLLQTMHAGDDTRLLRRQHQQNSSRPGDRAKFRVSRADHRWQSNREFPDGRGLPRRITGHARDRSALPAPGLLGRCDRYRRAMRPRRHLCSFSGCQSRRQDGRRPPGYRKRQLNLDWLSSRKPQRPSVRFHDRLKFIAGRNHVDGAHTEHRRVVGEYGLNAVLQVFRQLHKLTP